MVLLYPLISKFINNYKMKNNFKLIILSAGLLAMSATGCKKGYFDINSPNPNTPSEVPPKFILSASLNQSAVLFENGFTDFSEYWMGYWAPSGDYIPDQNLLRYNVTTDFNAGNWNTEFLTLANYKKVIDASSADPKQAYPLAMAKIMWAFHFQQLVDMYNNVPYSSAFDATNLFPAYDEGQSVYEDILVQLDGALSDIANAPADAESIGSYDVMFKGNMSNWQKFANTLKLRILMHQAGMPGREGYVSAGIGAIDQGIGFLTVDAAINPGYANTAGNKQNPKWNNVGYDISNQETGGRKYNRACSYAVAFYEGFSDPRLTQIYALNSLGEVRGREFGSSASGEQNAFISALGTGILKSATMPAVILPVTETYFLMAEAAQRGYLSGDAGSLYASAVTESFKLYAVPDFANAAASYLSQSDGDVNFENSSNKINTILVQKWAALNSYDPLESWSTWKRTGIPSDLPISIYPGVSAPHVPYRLAYPTSEYSFNAANAKAQGTIDPITSKIFWMP